MSRPLIQRIGAAWKALTRNYDAAGSSGRWPVRASIAAPNSAILAQRAMVERRSNYLIGNAPIAASIANVLATHLVGDGPSAQSQHPDPAVRLALESAWNRFFTHADIEGGDLTGLLNLVAYAMPSSGEAFVRLLTNDRGELRLQILPSTQIDSNLNQELPDGRIIVAGIERTRSGKVLAYHILPVPPDGPFAVVGPAVRVDAADICHVFEKRIAGQVRGMPWLAASATHIMELDSLEDAALAKAKVSCLFAGFIRKPEDTNEDYDDDEELGGLEPGTLHKLLPGEEIEFTPVGEFSGINEFLKHMARSICAGVGTPYSLVTGDLSDVTYSSSKVGIEAFKRRCRAIRSSLLVARLLQPAWERLVTLEILSGRLQAQDFERNPDPYFAATFMFPEWASLDPYRETQAEVAAVNAGFRSRQEVISARGRDPSEVDAEIQADTFVPRSAPQTPVNNGE